MLESGFEMGRTASVIYDDEFEYYIDESEDEYDYDYEFKYCWYDDDEGRYVYDDDFEYYDGEE